MLNNNALVQMYQGMSCPVCRRGTLDCFSESQDGRRVNFKCSDCSTYLNFDHAVPNNLSADQLVHELKGLRDQLRDTLNAINENLREASRIHTDLVELTQSWTAGK